MSTLRFQEVELSKFPVDHVDIFARSNLCLSWICGEKMVGVSCGFQVHDFKQHSCNSKTLYIGYQDLSGF